MSRSGSADQWFGHQITPATIGVMAIQTRASGLISPTSRHHQPCSRPGRIIARTMALATTATLAFGAARVDSADNRACTPSSGATRMVTPSSATDTGAPTAP